MSTRHRAVASAATAVLSATALAGAVAMAGAAGGPPGHAAPAGPGGPLLEFAGRYDAGFDFTDPAFDDTPAAETFAIAAGRMYVTNVADRSLDVVDVRDVSAPERLARIPLPLEGNSVAAHGDLVAVALEASPKTDPGVVRFFRRRGDALAFVRDVAVGPLPDMVTFTRDGRLLLVANEGEPSGYGPGDVDPEGSVSIVDVRAALSGRGGPVVRTAGFGAFDEGGPRHGELPGGIRLNGPGATVAQDLEPEYIDVDPRGRIAYVSLQEANALALVDIRRARVARIVSLGVRDHSAPGHGLDPSDRDDPANPATNASNTGAIAIAAWPVVGIPMPDGIAAFRVEGRDYVITANEGDAREWGDFEDVARAGGLPLDPSAYPDAAALQRNRALGRLNVSTTDGLNAAGTAYARLHAFGTRSVSIVRPDGHLVWDSGDAFERTVAAQRPDVFNASNSNNVFDNRSDDKGPEPEGVAVGRIAGRTYAFVALERVGGIMVLDVTDPARGRVVQWANTRDYAIAPPYSATARTDSGPEIVRFLDRRESPTGRPLVAYSNEVSGTVVFMEPRR